MKYKLLFFGISLFIGFSIYELLKYSNKKTREISDYSNLDFDIPADSKLHDAR